MAFNQLTRKYEFDFDSISFPVELSENVMRYLYHSNRGDSYRGKIEYEQFKSILNGDDRSYAACIVLSYLIDDRREGLRIPPKCFEILSDNVTIETRHYKDLPQNRTHPVEIHEGQCTYNGRVFDYKYEVKVFEGYIFGGEFRQRGSCCVVLEGDDFIVENDNMHIACAVYDIEKQFINEHEIYKKQSKVEEQIWNDFQKTHKQELIDWLTSIIYRGRDCLVCRLPPAGLVSCGRPPYKLVKSLDQGYCSMCSKNCKVKDDVLVDDEHSDKWYELGIDKLNFKYICGDYTTVLSERMRQQEKEILNKYKNPVYSNIDYVPPRKYFSPVCMTY